MALVIAGALMARRALRPAPFDPRRTPVGETFGLGIPGFLVAAPRASAEALQGQRSKAFPTSARASLAAPTVKAVDDLLTTIVDASRPEPDADDRRHEAFLAAVPNVNAALQSNKQPYFLDGDILGAQGRRLPLLLTFYVQRDDALMADGAPERVVYLWRLDHLNLRKPYLGYTRPSMGAAIVSLDEVETELVRWVLPSLGKDEPVELVDAASRDTQASWQGALEAAAGAAVRLEIDTGRDPLVAAVGRLLAQRRRMVRSWVRDLGALGLRLTVPERLVPEHDYAGDLAGRLGRGELADWTDLHDELLDPAHLAAFERIRDAHAAGVARHEVQHRLDFRRDLHPLPLSVRALLGVRDELALSPTSLPARVRDEHAAYLVEIASGSYPHTDIVLLARFVFDKEGWGDAYGYTALALLEDLATHLALPAYPPLVERRQIQREHAASLVTAILARPSDELRDAARRAYLATHGRDIAAVTQVSSSNSVPWRH